MFYYPLLKKCSLKNNPYVLTKSFFSLFSPRSSPFVFSPCRYSSFSLCFSMLPLLLFALFMFIDSLLCFFCLCLFLFFEKKLNLYYLFSFCWKSLNFELVISLFFCFVPFSVCFFRWCSFEQDQVYHFFERKEPLVKQIPPRISFQIFCDRIFLKEFYHHIPLQKNLNCLKSLFSLKIEETCFTTKVAFGKKNIFVQISFCGNLFVFRKISVSPAFSEKVCLYHLFFFHLQLIFATISFENLISEKKASFYLLLIFLFEESLFYFSIAVFNFCLRLLCFSFLLFLLGFVWWIHFSVCPIKKKKTLKKYFEKIWVL